MTKVDYMIRFKANDEQFEQIIELLHPLFSETKDIHVIVEYADSSGHSAEVSLITVPEHQEIVKVERDYDADGHST